MHRDIDKTLIEWKNNPRRLPLLLRGARQVGKSYTVRAFGENHFDNLVEIDFELAPQFTGCFSNLDPAEINQKISILARQDIIAGKTLLFLDEIQKCPQAIKSLRYYFEKMPQLHIIAAGSLLEFALESEKLEVPVGRVQYLFMRPMSFGEFCTVINEDRLREQLGKVDFLRTIDDDLHTHAINLLNKYYLVGGMPAVVDEFRLSGNIRQCQHIQASINQTYRDDFGKYASRVKHRYLELVFMSVPKMVGDKFKYSHVDGDIPSRELKEAVELLEKAGVVNCVKATGGDGLPMEAGAKSRHFKYIFLDVGLMQNMCGYSGDIMQSNDILSVHRGAVAEQFVGTELMAAADPYSKPLLYYWVREAKNSCAELDYCIAHGSKVIPVEVKSGPRGKLKSLQLFMIKYNTSKAVVISQKKYYQDKEVLFLPLYAIEHVHKVLQ